MRGAILAVLLAAAGSQAGAQAIGQSAAAKQLFPTRGIQLAVSGALNEQERAVMGAMVEEADRAGQPFYYYGSIAYSPSEGLTGQSISGAFNYHSTTAADSAALAACNATRRSGSQQCQIAAQILPRGYEPGRIQLSFAATSVFRSTYRKVRSQKAFAISQRTGAYQIAEGDDAADAAQTAVEFCNEKAVESDGPADCTVVIVN